MRRSVLKLQWLTPLVCLVVMSSWSAVAASAVRGSSGTSPPHTVGSPLHVTAAGESLVDLVFGHLELRQRARLHRNGTL